MKGLSCRDYKSNAEIFLSKVFEFLQGVETETEVCMSLGLVGCSEVDVYDNKYYTIGRRKSVVRVAPESVQSIERFLCLGTGSGVRGPETT